jgi:large subunit ribosomal protein L28
MPRICTFTGKTSLVGNRVSHANNKTKVRLLSNLQEKRIFVPSLGRFVRVRLSTSALRSVNKMGIEAYAAKVGITLK